MLTAVPTPRNERRYVPEIARQTTPNPAKLIASTTGETHRLLLAKLVAQGQ